MTNEDREYMLNLYRQKGEWIIDTETRTMKCNRCGATENADRLLVDDMNFCYNCGADMRKRGDKK